MSTMKAVIFKEYICLSSTASIAKMPSNMGPEEAATLPVGAVNARHFLGKTKIRQGQKVLIYGAGGSIGTYAVQLAKSRGAEVTAVDRGSKLEMLRGWWTSRTTSKKVFFEFARDKTANLQSVRDLVEAGQMKAVIDRRYSLEQLVEAHRYVEDGHKQGNVVISIASDSPDSK